jgi:TolA-binding protein
MREANVSNSTSLHCQTTRFLVALIFAVSLLAICPLAIAQLADESQDENQPLPDVKRLEQEATELTKRVGQLIAQMEKLKGRLAELPEQLQREIDERKFDEAVRKLEQSTF